MPLFRNEHEKRLLLTGYIIYSTVEIERKIDNFIAKHFCKSKKLANQLKQTLLFTERLTFDAKKDVLISVLKNDYKRFIEDNPKFIANLSEIAPQRNVFAHLDVDYGAKDLTFKKYAGGELKLKKSR
jgi:SAM-dependent MidA family methyltransferase